MNFFTMHPLGNEFSYIASLSNDVICMFKCGYGFNVRVEIERILPASVLNWPSSARLKEKFRTSLAKVTLSSAIANR